MRTHAHGSLRVGAAAAAAARVAPARHRPLLTQLVLQQLLIPRVPLENLLQSYMGHVGYISNVLIQVQALVMWAT